MKRKIKIASVFSIILLSILLHSCKKKEDNITMTDIDGNIYNTVTIGTQVWMKENLKTTRYRTGDSIGTTNTPYWDITSELTPEYQWAYPGKESNVKNYGRLYTWYAVTDSRNVCPTGWHVSTDLEWTTLITYLGGESVAGGKLKKRGTTFWTYPNWKPPNTGATNESGFTALPGSFRDPSGYFGYIEESGGWWSSTGYSTEGANSYNLVYNESNVRGYISRKQNGYSVRCVKD